MWLSRVRKSTRMSPADRSPHAGVPIADRRAVDQEARNLVGNGFGLRRIRIGRDHPNRRCGSRYLVERGFADGDVRGGGKRIRFRVAESIRPIGHLVDRGANIVDEHQQLADRSKAPRDGGTRGRFRRSASMNTRRRRAPTPRHRGIRRSTACGRRREGEGGIGRDSSTARAEARPALASATARGWCPELVDQHVLVARFKPIPAARELHLAESNRGALGGDRQSSTPCLSSVRRYSSCAIANSRRTPRPAPG